MGGQNVEQTDISAVEMTRRIRDAHYELVKEMSPEEQIAFYREKARSIHGRSDEDEQEQKTEELGPHTEVG